MNDFTHLSLSLGSLSGRLLSLRLAAVVGVALRVRAVSLCSSFGGTVDLSSAVELYATLVLAVIAAIGGVGVILGSSLRRYLLLGLLLLGALVRAVGLLLLLTGAGLRIGFGLRSRGLGLLRLLLLLDSGLGDVLALRLGSLSWLGDTAGLDAGDLSLLGGLVGNLSFAHFDDLLLDLKGISIKKERDANGMTSKERKSQRRMVETTPIKRASLRKRSSMRT